MGKLSAADAAFYGFGLIKRDPLTFLSVAALVTGLVIWMALTLSAPYAELIEAQLSSQDDPTVALNATVAFFGTAGWYMLASLLATFIVLGAFNRALVFGKSRGWLLGLKLGMDELRLFVVTIIGWFFAYVLPYLGMVMVGGILGLLSGLALGATGNASLASVAVGVSICVAVLIGLGAMIWLAIRFSLMGPASVGEKRFVIFESWSMTKGRFWTLFFGYVLNLLVYGVVTGALIVAIGAAVGWESFARPEGPDLSVLRSVSLGPALIVGCIVYGLIWTLLAAAFYGVAARGYLAWKDAAKPRTAPT